MRIFMTMILSTIIGLVTLSIRIATILLQAGMGLKITLIVTQRQDHQYQHHAYQLSHMFMQDQVYLDSHGVREKEMVETPSLVFELMEHIKVQLQQIDCKGVPKRIIKQYSKNTLTKFLQAELMDPSQAALRMVRHFEMKRNET
jgi:hypothetical protein